MNLQSSHRLHHFALLITPCATTKDNDAIKHLSCVFPGCLKSSGWVNRKPIARIDPRLRSWTPKDIRWAQTRQTELWFWDICWWAGPSSTLPAVYLPYQTPSSIIQRFFKPKAFIPLLEFAIKSWSLPVWQMRGWQSLTVRGKQFLTILPWFPSEDATVGTRSEAVWNNAQLLVWYPCVGCAKKRSNMENGGIKGSKFKQSVTQKREKRCEQSCNQEQTGSLFWMREGGKRKKRKLEMYGENKQ